MTAVLSPLADWGAPPAQDVPLAPPERERTTPSAWMARNWVALTALALIVANDYKFRRRSATETLSGGVDAYILLEVAVYALVGAYLVLSQRGLPRPGRPPLVLLLATGYVGLIVAAAGYSPFRALASVRALETVVMFALACAVCARAGREQLHRFAHGFLVLVVLSVLYGIAVPTVATSGTQAGRFRWLDVHPITVGVFVGSASLVALTYLLTTRRERPGPRWPAWLYAVLLTVVGYALLATKTRNSVLGAAVGVAVLLWFLHRGRQRLAVLGLAVLTAAVGALLFSGTIVAYFVRGESAERLASLNSRTELWSQAYAAIAQQPVFGYGLSASRGIFLETTGLGGGHNAALNVGVDLGLFGLLVWVSLLLAVVARVLRVASDAPDGAGVDRALILGIIGFLLVGGIFFEGLGAVANVAANWLFLLVAWAYVLSAGSDTGPAGRWQAGSPRAAWSARRHD